MKKLPARQIHLDFHISEHIPGVGSRFSRENFQKALQLGHVNSITIFAKCHHGWCYYPSESGRLHPSLEFDLTGAMIDAAHEIGVRAPVYITVTWSANDAEEHPEWLMRTREGKVVMRIGNPDANPEDKRPFFSWKNLCVNSGYEERVYAHAREVCNRYPQLDGLFFDICYFDNPCYCTACMEGMKREGLDPDRLEDAKTFAVQKWHRFSETCKKILRESHPEATLFFNGGADPGRPHWHGYQTHFEMEDLPTTSGGYDKMPPRAKYFAHSGKSYIGMTGKFHTTWGEFGGYKTADALRYECAVIMAYGALCNVGDQMHPSGEMDLETYRIIGEAYRYVEQIEDECFGGEETTQLGIVMSGHSSTDEGLVRILLEAKLDFNIVLSGDDLSAYDVVILPDDIRISAAEAARFSAFIDGGGGLLLTGTSGLDPEGKTFLIDNGLEYIGNSPFDIDYMKLLGPIVQGIVASPFLFYESSARLRLRQEESEAEVLALIYEPYFSRTYEKYCSHQNTPYRMEPSEYAGVIRKGRVIHMAHRVCRQYHQHGAQYHRDCFINALRLLYSTPVLKVKMPSAGRARLVRQPDRNRYLLHLLYASPIQRGRTSVIEDLPGIYRIPVEFRAEERIRRVELAPQGGEIPFTQQGGIVKFQVPELVCHQMVKIDYEK
jgi:hypothetical protein